MKGERIRAFLILTLLLARTLTIIFFHCATVSAQLVLPPTTLQPPHPGPPAYARSFGCSLAVGDVNGDGYEDVVVGADESGIYFNLAGEAFLFLGGSTFDTTCDATLQDPTPEGAARFGCSLAVGDVNGDGYEDVVVGALGSYVGGISDAGEAFLFLGGSTFDTTCDFTLKDPTPEAIAYFGYSLAVGDANNDEYEDVVVGAPYSYVGSISSAGEAFLFLGGSTFDTRCDFTLQDPDPEAGALFGGSLAVGDVNGDGYEDVVVGAPYSDVYSISNIGEAFVFFEQCFYKPIRNLDTNITYLTIQSAINAPETLNGHTIFVEEGTYYEHVVVHKSVALIGEDRSNTIVDGDGTGNVITITANNVNLTGFTIQNSGPDWSNAGIYIDGSNRSTISHNIITNNHEGILLYSSYKNTVSGNNITANEGYGIELYSSSNNNSISGNNIVNNGGGIWLWFSSSNSISGNNIANNLCGIDLDYSSSNSISGNNIANNIEGIFVRSSSSNSISGNNITANTYAGIDLYSSSNNNSISGNNITANTFYGIFVRSSSNNNSISGNNITANNYAGIDLDYSSSNIISGNTFTDDGLIVWSSYNNSVEYNTVNGKPLVYLEGVANYRVGDAGQVILVRCDSIRVENLNLSRASVGVELLETNNSIISWNNIANNYAGIELYSSSNNNIISGNNITANTYCGIALSYSSNNRFFHNNFKDNARQVLSYNSANVWDDGYPSGGNYWSNYTGVDLYSGPGQNLLGSDGIGDTPHVIDANNKDNYPLIHPYGSIRNLNTNIIYLTIQSAINAPETLNGHTIFVKEGTYYEHVVVNKSVALIGEDKSNTIIDGSGTGTVITITANNVNITSFTIRNSGSAWPNAGIYIDHSSGNSISGNNITNNYFGIRLYSSSSNNSISGNNIANNQYAGIVLFYFSSNNSISGNNITANNAYGIFLGVSSGNSISGNNITANNAYGIGLDSSSSNSISGNNIANNQYNGIHLDYYSNYNSISGNNITANNYYGILLSGSSSSNSISGNNITANNYYGIGLDSSSNNNSISGNTITNNYAGIYLDSFSSNNSINGNTIANNQYAGILLYNSSNNRFFHNSFKDNTQQVVSYTSTNVWDDGYPSGGNYWSDYKGVDSYSGPYQNETGSDGIGDTPYVIDDNNRDNYPLIRPFKSPTIKEQILTVRIGGEEYPILLVSNSTLSHVIATPNTLHFRATGVEGTSGYISVVIPVGLNTTNIKVFLNGTKITPTITTNGTHYFIYFAFTFTSIYEVIFAFAEAPYAQFTLSTLYTVNLYLNGTLLYGPNLKVILYSYSGAYEEETTIWSGATPAYITLNVSHSLNWPIENATLVLTDAAGNILQTITTFMVHRTHLLSRIAQIDARWPSASPEERTQLFSEIVDIDMQWPYAPT